MDVFLLDTEDIRIEFLVRFYEGSENDKLGWLKNQIELETNKTIDPPRRPHEAAKKQPRTEIKNLSQQLVVVREQFKKSLDPRDDERIRKSHSKVAVILGRLNRMKYLECVNDFAKEDQVTVTANENTYGSYSTNLPVNDPHNTLYSISNTLPPLNTSLVPSDYLHRNSITLQIPPYSLTQEHNSDLLRYISAGNLSQMQVNPPRIVNSVASHQALPVNAFPPLPNIPLTTASQPNALLPIESQLTAPQSSVPQTYLTQPGYVPVNANPLPYQPPTSVNNFEMFNSTIIPNVVATSNAPLIPPPVNLGI